MTAHDAFAGFIAQQPSVRLSEDDIVAIAPRSCHIVMSLACDAELSQSPRNLCCASEGVLQLNKILEKSHDKHDDYMFGL